MSESTLHRSRRITLVESVVERIIARIADGTFKPGTRLPSERQLIEDLQVGRSSVREALQGLAVMGFVEIRPGHGTYVTSSADALASLRGDSATSRQRQLEMRLSHIEARRLLECETARLAASRADERGVGRLASAWDAYHAVVTRQHDLVAASDAHAAFHLTIARIGGNPFYPTVVSALLRAVPPSLRQSELMRPEDANTSISDLIERELVIHKAILDAIASHDPEAAVARMDDHMDLERHLVVSVLG
jgi:DNA-binding FadR family transcriptional regulator